MCRRFFSFVCFLFFIAAIGVAVSAQRSTDPPFPFPDRDGRRNDDEKIVKELLNKQQIERDKKEYEELLQRADDAFELSNEIEKAFEKNASLSPENERKLGELEKVVKKIRSELGGSDDGDAAADSDDDDKEPKDVRSAFVVLRTSTLKLVDEVKKSTRFTISAAAIQSSNAVIRVIKFLRLRD